jgi:RNA polymerase-binding protein DksA
MSKDETPVNSTHLSEEDLDHFKERLLEEQKDAESKIGELQSSIDEIENKMDDTNSGSAHHQGDIGSSEELRETNYTLIEKQKDKLDQITAALDRIETGNYGTCIVTGKPIQKGRLEVMPYTAHCVDAMKGDISPKSKERLKVNEAV